MSWAIIIFPFIGAFFGWIFNTILLKFLFHPVKPRKLAGFSFQGAIPSLQPFMAERIALAVEKAFITEVNLGSRLTDPALLQQIMPSIEAHIDHFLRVKLPVEMPVVGMFVGEKTIDTMKGVFMTELKHLFPEIMRNYANVLQQQINISTIIKEKIVAMQVEKMELLFIREMSKPIRMVKMVGALGGFVIGLTLFLLTLVVH